MIAGERVARRMNVHGRRLGSRLPIVTSPEIHSAPGRGAVIPHGWKVRMNGHRKFTPLAWIIPILLVFPIAWLSSFGVALAMWSRGRLSDEARDIVCSPIVYCARSPHCPGAIRDGIYWFGTLGGYGMSDIELYFLLCETQIGGSLEHHAALKDSASESETVNDDSVSLVEAKS